MTQVFISHPTPYSQSQENFLTSLEVELKSKGLNPVNLGKNTWSFESPMKPIKEMMSRSKAAVIVGLERFHDYIGYSKQHSDTEEEYFHRYRSSPWIQIEAGMAYMASLPLLILRESRVEKEGILDPNVSQFYVFDFDINKQQDGLTSDLKEIIENWSSHIQVNAKSNKIL